MHYARWRLHGDVSDDWARRGTSDAKQRHVLMAKMRVDPLGCWAWTGTKTAAGYGQMRVAGRREYVHRISYQLHKGAIPDGLAIDHLCRNRACINPEHLEAVHPKTNAMRGRAPGILAYWANRCFKGHEFTPKNTITTPSGHRRCRTCENASQRKYRLARKQRLAQISAPEPEAC
jgi:hypothetical protein